MSLSTLQTVNNKRNHTREFHRQSLTIHAQLRSYVAEKNLVPVQAPRPLPAHQYKTIDDKGSCATLISLLLFEAFYRFSFKARGNHFCLMSTLNISLSILSRNGV